MADNFGDSVPADAGDGWVEAKTGTWMRGEAPHHTAVVFNRMDGWRAAAVGDGQLCLVRGVYNTPRAAADALATAEAAGASSRLWAPPQTTGWQASKPKQGRPGFWRKAGGRTLSVRRCSPPRNPWPGYTPSWIATLDDTMVMLGGRPHYFAGADDAMAAADSLANLPR